MSSHLFDASPRRVHAAGLQFLAGCLALALTACASTPAPTEQLAVSTAAVADATSAGAAVWAPTELGSARDKLQRANTAMTAKDYDSARTLAKEAQADAQLADAKVSAGKARKAADEVQDASRALRDEMNRKTK